MNARDMPAIRIKPRDRERLNIATIVLSAEKRRAFNQHDTLTYLLDMFEKKMEDKKPQTA